MKKEKERTEGRKEREKRATKRIFFFVPKRCHVTASRTLHSASNPISQKVLSFMGQMIQLRYYCTGRQGEDEMKH